MFNKERIFDLTVKGYIEPNKLGLDRYVLIRDEEISTKYCKFNICLWSNGDITFRDYLNHDLDGEFISGRISGKGTRVYKEDIKEAIKMFNEKHKDIIEYLEND